MMISTKEHNLRNAIFFTIKTVALILVICFAIEIPIQVVGKVTAANKVYYISEIKMFQAEEEADAKRACQNEGFFLADRNLNAGTGKEPVYMGYKLTEDKRYALYDIKLLHMDSGYQIKDYADASRDLEKSNSGAAETMNASANEFILNYNNGSPKAKEAYEGLNLFCVPEANNTKLGDYIISKKANQDFFAKLISHASTGAVNAITNFLAAGLTPYEKEKDTKTGKEVDITWADNVKNSSLWEIIGNPNISKDELDDYDKDYGDEARELHKQLQQFATRFENGEANFNEKQYVNEAKNTNLETVVEKTEKPSEEDSAMAFVNAYNFLNKYQANETMPLGEYLVDIGKQTSTEVDLRKLYPIIDSMTYAQSRMAGMAGLTSIISNLGENKENDDYKKIIEKAKKKIKEDLKEEAFSIWINTNPEMANKKVAFTSDAIRLEASGQLLNAEAVNKWDDAKKTISQVLNWLDVGSNILALLTWLTGEYGIVGMIVAAKSSVALVATSATTIATKIMAISAAVSSWAGVFALVVLAVTIWLYVIMLIVDYVLRTKPKKYTEMAEFAIDSKIINNKVYNLTYKAVRDNQNRIADLNGYKAQNGWVCMYVSDDPNSGSPIRADESGNVFNILFGDSAKQNGYDCVSFFGQITPGNCNTGAKKDEVNGIYINYYTDKSLANRAQGGNTGSTDKPADGTKLYYADMIVRSGKNESVVKAKLTSEGYKIIDHNLSPGARKVKLKQDQYSYIGYKTTSDPKLAIRDIRVATFYNEGKMYFGQLKYGCAGKLGFPADRKEENSDYPTDLDGLYISADKEAGTPIEVGNIHFVSDSSQAQPGWEPVTTFSGAPYNFATSRYSLPQSSGGVGRYRVRPYSYTGYVTEDDNKWENQKNFMYYEPEEKYTEGTKYLSGVFYAFGADSETGVGYLEATEAKFSQLYDALSKVPYVEQPNGSKDVNLAQSYFYKGHIVDSNQKYMRLYYTWTYNPYRALTDVQAFRGEPYMSKLTYTISKAIKYDPKPSGSATESATYAAASVMVQRSIDNKEWVIRAFAPENAYMAPNGLLGDNDIDCVYEGFTRDDQGSLKTSDGKMPWLPTNLYVTGYVKDATRLTLDSVVVSQNKHDATENNGVFTCDVSDETTLAGNKPSGSFNSVQELKDPYNKTAFNIALPSWTDDGGDSDDSDEKNGSHYHEGVKVYMYIKHETIKKRYISRIFVGASSRDKSENKDKDVLKAYDKQVDLLAMAEATAVASDEVIPYDAAGDPTKSWTVTLKAGDKPETPKNGDPAAYISVARTDDVDKAIRSIVLYKSNEKAVPNQLQFDSAVYYCASATTPIKMNDNNTYYIYYSYNQGTVPGKPFTELHVNEDVFISGSATALVVDRADITEEDPVYHKNQVVQAAEFKGDSNLKVFIKGEYEADKVYFNKIYTASADNAKDAQLRLLEQGCTEFCDIDLNKAAGGKYIYFGYRSYGLNEKEINKQPTAEARDIEIEKQRQEAIYDIVCTVGEEFHPEGIVTDRYQLYYAPVAKEDKNHNLIPTDLNEGTTGPKIYMYYTTPYVAKRYNETAINDPNKVLSVMPKDYMKSPLTKMGFALYDYVPYSKDLVAQSQGSDTKLAWEYVLKRDYSAPVELNEAAIHFDNHKMSDNRISMFVQRENGFVKDGAEITGGYMFTDVTENKLMLEK